MAHSSGFLAVAVAYDMPGSAMKASSLCLSFVDDDDRKTIFIRRRIVLLIVAS